MPIRQLQRRLDAAVVPFLRQLADALLHGDRHLDAGQRVLLNAQRRRIAEEHDYGVADVFVDGRAVLQRDLRHFGEIVVEELGEVLELHFVGDFGETDEVGKANRELLALADDLDVLLAGEDRIVNLRRQVFRELGRQRRQRRGLLGQILLALLELGDVGIDRDCAAVLGAALADHHPAAVGAALHLRLARIAMLLQAIRNPFLDAAFRILDIAPFRSTADDGLERRAGGEFEVQARIKQVAVVGIADHQPVLAVVADEAFGDALDRLGEPALAAQPRLLGAAQWRDVVEPEQPLAAGHRDVAAGIGHLNVGDQKIEQFAAAWSSRSPPRSAIGRRASATAR